MMETIVRAYLDRDKLTESYVGAGGVGWLDNETMDYVRENPYVMEMLRATFATTGDDLAMIPGTSGIMMSNIWPALIRANDIMFFRTINHALQIAGEHLIEMTAAVDYDIRSFRHVVTVALDIDSLGHVKARERQMEAARSAGQHVAEQERLTSLQREFDGPAPQRNIRQKLRGSS